MFKSFRILIFLFPFLSFGQTEVFVDKNLKEISKQVYLKKCKAYVYKCWNYKTDSLIVNKVLYKFSFGKLTSSENNQLRLLLSKKSNKIINPNTTLIIKHLDTLFDYEAKISRIKVHQKSHTTEYIKVNSEPIKLKRKQIRHKRYIKKQNTFIKKQKKCIAQINKKYNSEVFHIYNYDTGYLKNFPDANWVKDNSVFKNKFFSISHNAHLLIIKPNGDYFLSGTILNNERFDTLLKNSDWSKYILDWKNSYHPNNINGVGLFKKKVSLFKARCFQCK